MKKPAPPAADPIPTRVQISAGEHQVAIESADSLRVVAAKALELWKATETGALARGVCSPGFGYVGDVVETSVPPDVTLPDRLTSGDDDDDRHTRTHPDA